MGGVAREVSVKNEALNRLNNATGNVYNLQTTAGPTTKQIVANKSNTSQGFPLGLWSEEMKLTRKDWKIVIVAVLATALIAYILFKTKLIKL